MMNFKLKHRHAQKGFVLVVSLIFLMVMTGLVVHSIRRATMDEKSSANMRSQTLSFQAAERALRFCEGAIELNLAAGEKFCKKKEVLTGQLATLIIGNSEESAACPPKDADFTNPQANFPDCSMNMANWTGAGSLAITIALNNADPNFITNVIAQPQCMVERWKIAGNDLKTDKTETNPAYVITARAVGANANAVVWLQETIRCGKDGQ